MSRFLVLAIFFASVAAAQRPPLNSPLLDRLSGEWVLQGTIAGKQATHDVTAEWVANHQYLRLHEVSREKAADGKPQYDAFIHIGWNERKKAYSIIWLDSFWGIDPEAIGTAVPGKTNCCLCGKTREAQSPSATTFAMPQRPIRGSGPWITS
jgi:hypothetical protein